MLDWLSGFRAQTGPVANCSFATFFRRLGEKNGVDPFDWFPEKGYWTRLVEAPSGMREDYRGALRHINGDSPFTQPPLSSGFSHS